MPAPLKPLTLTNTALADLAVPHKYGNCYIYNLILIYRSMARIGNPIQTFPIAIA